MSEEIKNNRFVFTVLKLLEPMGDIDCTALSDEIIGLSKNNTMFALIVGPELYLRTKKNDTEIYQDKIDVKGNRYNKIGRHFLNNQDVFLQIVTKSYWVATGKH